MVSPDASTPGTELTQPDGFKNDELRSIENLDDIRTLLGGEVINAATEIGNGFSIMDSEQKNRLCGVPVLFLSWDVNVGDHGLFVSAYVVELDKNGKVVGKWIVNDGSMKSGMGQQLKELTDEKGIKRGLYAPNGLRRSDYTFTNDKGEESPASTYYVDLSA